MVRLYRRESSYCEPEEVDPGLGEAIAGHAEACSLGDVLANAVACCLTVSTRLYTPGLLSRWKGMADPDPQHRTLALFTPRWFVVAVTRSSTGTTVLSARLDGMTLAEHSALADRFPGGRRLPEDSGVTITALWSGRSEQSSYHVALGDDADGRFFSQALREAVARAKQS
ncbi:hypothetical protein AB0I06_17095 [Streptomyces sp. NPDC050674]|uniref:hypothetical protein n=1 Tax=Streptomyces sp. NPDC050674 TaxID=3157216 RepID=UPI00343296C5